MSALSDYNAVKSALSIAESEVRAARDRAVSDAKAAYDVALSAIDTERAAAYQRYQAATTKAPKLTPDQRARVKHLTKYIARLEALAPHDATNPANIERLEASRAELASLKGAA